MYCLLPKNHDQFKETEYWNEFFLRRGNEAFEWYGEFIDLYPNFSKYIKLKDDILIVGCGNSKFSAELYDVGHRNITNIDISPVVIEQMSKTNTTRPEMKYEQMDATNMTYLDSSYSVIIDKGTLDALVPNSKKDTITNTQKYLREITRILCHYGRYICISLLQNHILELLLKFMIEMNFMIKIIKHDCIESRFPVFIVIATKVLTKLTEPVLELVLTSNSQHKRLNSIQEMNDTIVSIQQSKIIQNTLSKKSVADEGEITLDVYRPNDASPKYTVHVLDRPRAQEIVDYAAFIVPQGKETDWFFATKKGRQQVLNSSKKDRLAIFTLNREHTFDSWEEVKCELHECVMSIAPLTLPTGIEIPILSFGNEIGVRNIICQGESEISGCYVIEEVERDNVRYRRLVFLNNPYQVQSEAKLLQVKSRRGKSKVIIDPAFLACQHHKYMSTGVGMISSIAKTCEIVIIGLGGGGLCTFLHRSLKNLVINAVDLDEVMLKISVEYFDMPLDERLQVIISDGIKFLESSSKQSKKYQAILFDIDNKDTSGGLGCPPPQFLKPSTINLVVQCLAKNGVFILNLVIRDLKLKDCFIEDIKKIFPHIASFSCKDEINDVLICSMECKNWKDLLKNAISTLKPSISDIEFPSILKNFKIISK